MPRYTDPSLTHGQRCIVWSMVHELVAEEPPGSNRGPEISEWLRPCQRDGYGPELGEMLAKHGANWCAAFACAADRAARIEGDPPPVHGYRASGIEMENDAKAVGAWRDVALVRDGSWEPAAGDVVIWQSGDGSAGQRWRRHVARFIQRDPMTGRPVYAGADWKPPQTFTAIGGNEQNRVGVAAGRSLTSPLLLGFIELPRVGRCCDLCGKPATCVHYDQDAHPSYACLFCCGHAEGEGEGGCESVAADAGAETVNVEVLKRAARLEDRLWRGAVGMDAFDELLKELEAADPRKW